MIRRYENDLKRELKAKKLSKAFERIKRENKIFGKYSSVEALCVLFGPGNKNYKDKDEVMSILLNELKKETSIYPLINMVFWRSLLHIYQQRCRFVPDHEELFSRLQYEFYETVVNTPMKDFSPKITVSIYYKTRKKIEAWEKNVQRIESAYQRLADLFKTGHSCQDINEMNYTHNEKIEYLTELLYRNIINEIQYELIIDTLIYKDMNMREWAKQKNIPYNTVLTLRNRARKKIMNFFYLKKMTF